MNFIGGNWRAGAQSFDRVNPARTDEVLGSYPESTPADVAEAVGWVAEHCGGWAATAPADRARVLHRAADWITARADDLAVELVREEGKTLAEARQEVSRTPDALRLFAVAALTTGGHTYPSGDGSLVYTSRQPVGVVAAITPWNFPLSIPARKVGPALAAGNGVVLKPSEVTPLLGQRLVEALLASGLPAGAIALIQGGGPAGAALVADPRITAVTFTGSTTVGTRIHRVAGPARRCQLEMGGKNPLVVLADADPDRAAALAVKGAFGLSGQACTGTSRLIVHIDLHDELVTRITAAMDELRVGDGLDPAVTMGPLATHAQLDKVASAVASAKRDGATCHVGRPVPDGGWFHPPVLLTNVAADMAIARDEVFGPVLAVLPARSFDEAVALANDTTYGLSAGIVTGDIAAAMRFAAEVDAGLVKVNQTTSGMALNAPFGGVKQSSTQTHKEQGGDTMMHFYTTEKTVYVSG